VHDLRLQCNDIGAEAHEDLRSGLSADAAIDDTSFEELWVRQRPSLGDRISYEDNSGRFVARAQALIGRAIAA
jgi:hypothetical protein